MPGPLSPAGVPAQLSRRAGFDALTLDVAQELAARWEAELRGVEFGVEDVPLLPDEWRGQPVPLATLVRGDAGRPTRIVVFRLPVQQRASGPSELKRLVHDALAARVAELLGRDPDDIAPPP